MSIGKQQFNSSRSKVRIKAGKPVILLFRQDLRVRDQPALCAAANCGPVIPVYVLDMDTPGEHKIGSASLWWLHYSLLSLKSTLKDMGLDLILRKGPTAKVISEVASEVGASEIHAIKHYEPWWAEAEQSIQKSHKLILHDGNQLLPPGTATTGSGKPFKIYTPFWRALLKYMPPPACVECPKSLEGPDVWPQSEELDSWNLLPKRPNWAKQFELEWTPGEDGAQKRLEVFSTKLQNYAKDRDYPSVEGTSKLSPHLHYGEISPRTIWLKLADKSSSTHAYLNEIGWRDYAQNILLLYPNIGWENCKPRFDKMKWRDNEEAMTDLSAWKRGNTGYPIVDAGMRQLWATGWMHNRVRMITASFLVKHLLIDWRKGEEWFWDCLVDADYGSNSVAWQWISGSGIDSNMWSRIMAPLVQSVKFDAGNYIRTWVKELEHVNDDSIHDPDDKIRDRVQYPRKMIDHKEGRERALERYDSVRD